MAVSRVAASRWRSRARPHWGGWGNGRTGRGVTRAWHEKVGTMHTLFRVIQKIEAACLAYGVLGLAALSITNVLSRSLLNESLAFADEVAQFLMVFVTFIGAGYAASQGRHIRMSALYDQLPRRTRKALMLLITGATGALMFVLTYHAVRYAAVVGSLGTVSPALGIPLWVVYAAAPLGLALAGVEYALAFARNLLEPDVFVSFMHTDAYEPAPGADEI